MDSLIGKWKLLENKDLDKFLIFYGYGWVKRQLALVSNIDLKLEITENPNIIKRIIDSSFLSGEELYYIDNKFHKNNEGLDKQHELRDNKIYSKVQGTSFDGTKFIFWNEIIEIENDKLIVRRFWEENGKQTCSQIFEKYSN